MVCKKSFCLICVIALFVLGKCEKVYSQISPEWVDTVANPPLFHCAFTKSPMQVDGNGNVYAAELLCDTSSTPLGLKLLKYNTNGVRLVDTVFNHYGAERLETVIDDSANFYVAIYHIQGMVRIYKFNSSLNLVWLTNAPAASGYQFLSVIKMIIDKNRNIYITGEGDTITNLFNGNTITMKINSSGSLVWARKYAGAGSCLGIGTDSLSNVYIITRMPYQSGSNWCINLVKYHSFGWFLWDRQFVPWNSSDVAVDLKVTKAGNCYILGVHSNPFVLSDFVLAKYNTSGNLQWHRLPYTATCENEPRHLLIDSLENVYLGGTTCINNSLQLEYVTYKYDSSGNMLWQRFFNTNQNLLETDYLRTMSIDKSSNIFLSGYNHLSTSSLTQISTIKYNTNGDTLWNHAFVFNNSTYNFPIHSGCDNSGNFYLMGSVNFNPPPIYPGMLFLKYGFTTGLEEINSNENQPIIFPNPCHNFLRIQTPNAIKEDVLIYNYTGQVIKHLVNTPSTNAFLEVNTSALKRGLYFVKHGDAVAKFIKE